MIGIKPLDANSCNKKMKPEKQLYLQFLNLHGMFYMVNFTTEFNRRYEAGYTAYLALGMATQELLSLALSQRAGSSVWAAAGIRNIVAGEKSVYRRWRSMMQNESKISEEIKKGCELSDFPVDISKISAACLLLLKFDDECLSTMRLSVPLANGIYLNRVKEIVFLANKVNSTINLEEEFWHLVGQLDHDNIYSKLFAPVITVDLLEKLITLPSVLIELVVDYTSLTGEDVDHRLLTWKEFNE